MSFGKDVLKHPITAGKHPTEMQIVLKGKMGSVGIKGGRARIVKSEKDLKYVEDGDILVAIETNANYLEAMKLAGAFVTETGTISSHAAITARSMRKPCIVGAVGATKTLKHGVFYVVDGVKGIVYG